MRNVSKTHKDRGDGLRDNRSKKLILMGSMSALLAACGGGSSEEQQIIAAPRQKTINDKKTIITDHVDIMRGQDKELPLLGGKGEDIFVVVGVKTDHDYQITDIKNPIGVSVDLTKVISPNDINGSIVSDLVKGGILDGQEDGAVLVTFGDVSVTNSALKNIHKIVVHDTLRMDADQLQDLANQDNLTLVGSDRSSIVLNDSDTLIDVDLQKVSFENIKNFTVGENIYIKVLPTQVDQLKAMGVATGSIKIIKGDKVVYTSDDGGIEVTTDADNDNGLTIDGGDGLDVDFTSGDDILQSGATIKGTDAAETLEGGAGSDILVDEEHLADQLLGGAGYDYFVIKGNPTDSQYVDADLKNPMGLDVDLSDILDASSINAGDEVHVYEAHTFDGDADKASLITFGDLDLKISSLSNIDHILVHDKLALTAEQINKLKGEGLNKISATDHSELVIEGGSASDPVTVDLSDLDISSIQKLTLGEHVILKVDQDQLAEIGEISGLGSIKNADNVSELDLSDVTVAAEINHAPISIINIDGTKAQNETLTANVAVINDPDGNGDGNYGYQWMRGDNEIAGATEQTYDLTQADVGEAISVKVSYRDGNDRLEVVTSSATFPIANVNDTPTGTVSVTGLGKEDAVLTATINDLADLDGVGLVSYQWQRDGVDIAGANQPSLTLDQSHVGGDIRVKISYTDGEGTEEVLYSDAIENIANVNDPTMGNAIIEGVLEQGEVLTATWDNFSDGDGQGVFSYQWYANGSQIVGATSKNFTLSQAQVDQNISVEITHVDPFGGTHKVNSNQSQAVQNVNDDPDGDVILSGNFVTDATLSADASNITDQDGLGSLSYQWYKDGVAIAGATGDEYLTRLEDMGSNIHVEVRYQDGFGTLETISSPSQQIKVNPTIDFSKMNKSFAKIMRNEDSQDHIGKSDVALGDVNGDGIDDFAIYGGETTINNNGLQTEVARMHVVYGQDDAYEDDFSIDNLNGDNGFVIDYKGSSASFNQLTATNAGDVNGDGYNDILLSKPSGFEQDGNSHKGHAYIVYGQADQDQLLEVENAVANVVDYFAGASANSYLGQAIAGGADFNNDGYDDIVLSMRDGATQKYLLKFGSNDGISDLSEGQGKSLSFEGSGTNGLLVNNISFGGDLNGDGFEDLVLTANHMGQGSNIHSINKNYVIFGSDDYDHDQFTGLDALNNLDGSNGFEIISDDQHRDFKVKSMLGDFNGDGINDLIMSSAQPNNHNLINKYADKGHAYVFFGKKDGYVANFEIGNFDQNDGIKITGVLNGFTGADMDNIGDFNGDGLDDLVLTSKAEAVAGESRGASYVIYGQKGSDIGDIDLENLSPNQGFKVIFDETNYSAFDHVSALGDVNGDGLADIGFNGHVIGSNDEVKTILYGNKFFSNPNMASTQGNDSLTGTSSDDDLVSGLGNDNIAANAGDDYLSGGHGNDILNGGAGSDILKGGAGRDLFQFKAGDSALALDRSNLDKGLLDGFDIITDFESNSLTQLGEKIVIDGGVSIATDATIDGVDSDLRAKDGLIGSTNTIKSHKIENGIISFDDQDVFAGAIDITDQHSVAAVVDYLQKQDLGDAGTAVAFDNGANSYLFVQGSDDGLDVLDLLVEIHDNQFDQLTNVEAFGHQDLLIA